MCARTPMGSADHQPMGSADAKRAVGKALSRRGDVLPPSAGFTTISNAESAPTPLIAWPCSDRGVDPRGSVLTRAVRAGGPGRLVDTLWHRLTVICCRGCFFARARSVAGGGLTAFMRLNCDNVENVEPPVRIELTAYALQVRCSTTELRRHIPVGYARSYRQCGDVDNPPAPHRSKIVVTPRGRWPDRAATGPLGNRPESPYAQSCR